jgi:hypothetical protein
MDAEECMDSRTIKSLIMEARWIELSHHRIALSFPDQLRLAYRLFAAYYTRHDGYGFMDDRWHDKAIEVLLNLKQADSARWECDWRNEALLSFCYVGAGHYFDEAYQSTRHAADLALRQTGKVPPQLLVRLAGCAYYPGKTEVSKRQATEYYLQAVAEKPYVDAVMACRTDARVRGDDEEESKWDRLLKNIESTGEYMPTILPDTIEHDLDDWDALKE